MTVDLAQIPVVYQEMLQAFPAIDPYRTPGSGLAVQTLYGYLKDQRLEGVDYSLPYLRAACEELRKSGVVEIKNQIFVHPTERGENLIQQLTGRSALPPSPPAFPAELFNPSPRL